MRTISKGDILMGNKIPITIGIEQPFEDADDFYMLKEEDDSKCVVIGRVHMASKYKTINVQPERDETDPDVLQYFTDLGMEKSSMGKTFWFGPKFDTFSLLFVSGPFVEDETYKWHPDFEKLRLVPKLWAEFFYRE